MTGNLSTLEIWNSSSRYISIYNRHDLFCIKLGDTKFKQIYFNRDINLIGDKRELYKRFWILCSINNKIAKFELKQQQTFITIKTMR